MPLIFVDLVWIGRSDTASSSDGAISGCLQIKSVIIEKVARMWLVWRQWLDDICFEN